MKMFLILIIIYYFTMLVLNRALYIGHYIALSIVPSWGEYLLSLLGPEVYSYIHKYLNTLCTAILNIPKHNLVYTNLNKHMNMFVR